MYILHLRLSLHFRHTLLQLCILVGIASAAHAQLLEHRWQKLADFASPVRTVYFIDLPGPPRIGFVGTADGVYRTTDGGATWRAVQVAATSVLASDFAFKDSLTGWFSNFLGDQASSPCFKTTDGGLTWSPLAAPAYQATSVLYRPKQKLLLLTSWSPKWGNGAACLSTDEGASWTLISRGTPFTSVAFIDDLHGVMASQASIYVRTDDGGFTWSLVHQTGPECWQIFGDTLRKIFLTASEKDDRRTPPRHLIHRSTDDGDNFIEYSQYETPTGTMRSGSCGELYLQTETTSAFRAQGIVRSDDVGMTWSPVLDETGAAGPANLEDTRFFVKGSYIFAGGLDTLNRNPRLMRYVEDSTRYDGGQYIRPMASTSELAIDPEECDSLNTTLYAVYHNDCLAATLTDVTLLPTTRFTLALRDTLPHPLSGDYPIPIVYAPIDHAQDSAVVVLTYDVAGTAYSDTVRLYGSVPGSASILHLDLSANGALHASALPGDTIAIELSSRDAIPSTLQLDSISFVVHYNGDLLTPLGFNVASPWSLHREEHSNGRQLIVLSKDRNVSLAAGSPLISMKVRATVTDTLTSSVTADSIRLNDGAALYSHCVAIAEEPQTSTVTISNDCAAPLLQRFLANQPIWTIETVNVSQDALRVSIEAGSASHPTLVLSREDGNVIYERSTDLPAGRSALEIPIGSLHSGVYFLTLRSEYRQRTTCFSLYR